MGCLRLGAWAVVMTVAGVAPDPAFAQPASAAGAHPVQLSVGGLVFGETSFGSIDAEYIANNGSRLVVFRTENALRPGFGLEAHLGIGLTRAFEVEATGSWARADLRSRVADDATHVRDMIEQVLFTVPGERVNRPDFGCGLLQLVFAPNSDTLAAAVQMSVQGALQQWLGERIAVESVDVSHRDATLQVDVQYVLRQGQQRRLARFTRDLP